MKFRMLAIAALAIFLGPARVGANEYQILKAFSNLKTPVGRLARGTDGALYGTTSAGGAVNGGTVFKLSTDGATWTRTVIHSFGSGFDGAFPSSGVIVGADGNLYGTTTAGGAAGRGTVFRLSNDGSGWTYALLHEFTT